MLEIELRQQLGSRPNQPPAEPQEQPIGAEEMGSTIHRTATDAERISEHEFTARLLRQLTLASLRLQRELAYRQEVRAEINGLRDEINQLRGQITAVFASSSWRITAPLRSVTSILRRLQK
jgi:hypothetical protein